MTMAVYLTSRFTNPTILPASRSKCRHLQRMPITASVFGRPYLARHSCRQYCCLFPVQKPICNRKLHGRPGRRRRQHSGSRLNQCSRVRKGGGAASTTSGVPTKRRLGCWLAGRTGCGVYFARACRANHLLPMIIIGHGDIVAPSKRGRAAGWRRSGGGTTPVAGQLYALGFAFPAA